MNALTKLRGLASFSQPRPFVLAVLGPNGSGKSSIEHELGIGDRALMERVRGGRAFLDEESHKLGILTVNPDAIAASYMEAYPGMSIDEVNRKAQINAELRRRELAESGVDFAFETVGSHPSKVEFLQELKDAGYFIAVLAVSTEDPQINIRRVAYRVSQGGHDVPPEKVASRYARTSELMIEYYKVSDLFVAYDNSRDAFTSAEPGPRLVLVKDKEGVYVTPATNEVKWVQKHVIEKLG